MERKLKNQILADAVFLVALTNKRDQYYERALNLSIEFEDYDLLVTDAILLEVGNALARNHKLEAIKTIERLLSSDDVDVVHLTPDLFQRAFIMYKTFQDKAWSLVDCISFVVMSRCRYHRCSDI